MSQDVYITALGKFLPGEPVGNEEMEANLGLIGGKPSRLKSRILKQNGIQTRHYAIDRNGQVNYWNSDLAALAVKDAIAKSGLNLDQIELLATATSQSDLLAPGFASLVQGNLAMPPCEIASLHGVCAGSVAALKHAFTAIRAGEHANAAVCASEFTSRFFRAGLFEETRAFQETGRVPFDAEFLRWMLSDGAGAAVLESSPNAGGLSLRIDWIDLVSYADRLDVCMYAGANKVEERKLGRSWYDYQNFAAAAADGAILLKQDLNLLENIVPLGVARYFELIEQGRFHPSEVDWLVCHYSSHMFRGKIIELLEKGGAMIPEERWFTNLYTKGNTGAASLFIMLEELFNERELKPGQKILCMVPESGRFVVSFLQLTVVGSERATLPAPATQSDVQAEAQALPPSDNALLQSLARQLTQVWVEFETRLNQVPIIDKMNRGKLRVEDYRALLINLRQQVMEGARWIARAASNMTIEHFPLRSLFIGHAAEEHRDFQLIEQDFVSIGGLLLEIQQAEKNLGSEALSAWIFHRAGHENPFDLLGAMFIIEGLGNRLANRWGKSIREQLRLEESQVSFLLYHGANDGNHFAKLEAALGSGVLTEAMVTRIVKTARVTARLYALQLEELIQEKIA
ncbi:MAG TPA: 3-oxoacyl-[acyl-carrier-protein] synthase III C-terminal domain-containing protein [Blastocatellia bacterium]|nr:3-oxoacyl-[acyl-carrier-protein] synthase III C-terminal domain-containing protein [Blastocatellia bacterium]HMV84330.1 3-oxoacyl-[acyl-carrier-protein] synthase III C-terminal domain-containing protein [Blastocatellia bacterium]HMY74068.1 3-oxoacyl-[acyl-carrier-protein] synthase III C-terminal domain-containing protein [Blastocatellia bacterium]HMZ19104.1 3-oxoacyl-[acyl-carrier-protein] synthase III C-terminal domain-containing protein [Blastocatellia bacterium]HNG30681.1 3-oxoacyl-[acyl-